MQIRTWFGVFELTGDRIDSVELFPKDTDLITGLLLEEPLLMRGKVACTDLRDLAVEYGFVDSGDEYDRLLHELNIELVKKQMALAVTPDRQVIAAVEALDDINETTNILSERLKEWYMLNHGETRLRGVELANHILNTEYACGGQESISSFASSLIGLYETRSSIEKSLKDNMEALAPNLTNIAGYILGARLLSIAGSLEKLASMPSSTVQVLGANNALFKHLKGKAPSPKHGVIFRHPFINSAPKKLRGKIARAVASKISIAVRYDCYSGQLRKEFEGELEAKVTGIRKKNFPKPGKSRY
ncbi:MAG: rRNA biogenesis protein [Candidatus Methanoperedens sp.]|nr:rRNA biogenesis protein [Candidatus Methanoperedens sp.]